MKILISNDDGVMAEGIKALTSELSKEHDVYVIAPDRERSAAGHSLTLHTPIRVEELDSRFGAKRIWITSGTPGDCVKIGINAILEENEKPDIIISGINHGPNLGSDILYSGTVSCAMEGAMMGYPSIAVSLASMSSDPVLFKSVAKFMLKFLHKIKEYKFPPKTILNVNVPGLMPEDLAGVAITRLGGKMFTDEYDKRIDPRGKVYYWMAGELIKHCENDDSDLNALRWNKVSVTPITFEMTLDSVMPELSKFVAANSVIDWV
ncbi:MAG: 5'/3'-nucleotidase SurE [Candidatus Gastranaerophilales bacterium]|nr:5'/3'-nucleotidase SurE [Candidatus Gastranaerophilales bacterium]